MKLNPDCIRDVLLEIEKSQVINENGRLISLYINDLLESPLSFTYAEDEIFYSVKQLSDGYFIDAKSANTLGSTNWMIRDITPTGHEFIQNIRDNTVWEQTKTKAKGVGSFALNILSQIAVSIISSRLG